jgi:CRP/FNR family transcriptional regulator, anaerobic regulatory protein
MTPIRKGQSGSANGREHGLAASAAAQSILAKIEPYVVKIPARRRQKIAIPDAGDETLYYVRRGILLTHAEFPVGRSTVLSILYAGDVFSPLSMPGLPGVKLTCAADGAEVWRLRGAALSRVASTDSSVERFISRRLAEQSSRLALHNVLIAGLEGYERVVALITELAQRIGARSPAGITVDMPLSRTELAGYLALNADTVSRIFSRLRSEGVIAKGGHGRIILRDLRALEGRLPASLADVQNASGLPVPA